MLEGIDTLVIDLQDVGARFYTYTTTMAYVHGGGGEAEAAGRRARSAEPDRRCPDRGPDAREDRVGLHRLLPDADPPRHDARRARAAVQRARTSIGADLTVDPLIKNWRRDDWFDDTGLPWINPSPNMRNLMQATLYPGIGAIESTNISVGRGTTRRSSRSARRGSTASSWRTLLNERAAGDPLLSRALHADVEQVQRAKSVRACSWW